LEEILLVDLDDNEIGYSTKEDVHKYGTLHRAFSVFLVNEDKILIQRRNKNKYHSGGLWTNACCSHQRKTETLMDAVSRGLKEELGIECEVSEQFSFVYRTKFAEDLYEYEVDHVFLGKYDGQIDLNLDEADAIEWVSISDLKERLRENADTFTSWFIIAAPRVIKILETQ